MYRFLLSCFSCLFFLCLSLGENYISRSNLYSNPSNSLSESDSSSRNLKKRNKNLVRVAVMEFVNRQESKSYDYLASSLREATEKLLRRSFAYQQTSSKENKKALKQILRKQNRKERHLDETDIVKLSIKQDLDIVAYGHFSVTHDKEKDTSMISIQAKLYLSFFKEVIYLSEIVTEIDSNIFRTIESISSFIFEEIAYLIDLERNLGSTVIAGVVQSGVVTKKALQVELQRLKLYLKKRFGGDILNSVRIPRRQFGSRTA